MFVNSKNKAHMHCEKHARLDLQTRLTLLRDRPVAE